MQDGLVLQNRVKEARVQAGLSQAQLAELIGVSRNTISSIETGQFCPTAKLALRSNSICNALIRSEKVKCKRMFHTIDSVYCIF